MAAENPGKQHVQGTTVFLNTKDTGSFTVEVLAEDPESGVEGVTFPAILGSGAWIDKVAPFTRTYTWPVSSVTPGLVQLTVANRAGLARQIGVTVVADTTPPAAGTTVGYPTGRQPDGPVTVTVSAGGGDAGSGLASRVLARRDARLADNCQATATSVVATGDALGTVQDADVVHGGCYSYRVTETDKVGNSRLTTGSGVFWLNTAPEAHPAAVVAKEDTSLSLLLSGTDVDGDALTYRLEKAPLHGSLSGGGADYTYTPARDYTGTDSLRFSAWDGLERSATAAVDITVAPVEDGPTAFDGSLTVAEDGSTPLTLNGWDADADPLTQEIVSGPAHGRLTATATSVDYAPDPDYSGPDTLTFRVSDGVKQSATAKIQITVTPVNDAPRAQDTNIMTAYQTAVDLTLFGADPDGDPLTYTVLQAPSHGTLSGIGAARTYSPAAGYSGTDTFAYTVTDGSAASSPATVTVTTGAAPVTAFTVNKGIMSQGPPAAGHPYVNHVTGGTAIRWSDLEPTDQSFTGTAWSKIDALLNSSTVSGVRLRVYGGRYAPAFVKRIGGSGVSGDGYDCSVDGGIAVHNPYDNTGGCSPRFWDPAFLDQYQELMVEVARRYGNNPKLTEVVNSACMTTYAEPFYRAHSHAASNKRLWEAGLNRTTDYACQERAMAIHDRVFPNKPVSLAINAWEVIVDPALDISGRQLDWTATQQFVERWKSRLGSRLVLQNNGWGENEGCPVGKTPATNVYCFLDAVDQPKGYQSETWARLGDSLGGDSVTGWYLALERAIARGACFVESTDNQYRQADPVKLAEYDRRLEANC